MTSPGEKPLKCSLHDWAGLRSQLVYIFDGHQPKDVSDGFFERHGEISAWLLRKGWIRLESDGQSMTVRPGQWLVCTGKTITQELSHDVVLLSLRFRHDWPNGSPLLTAGPLCLFEAAEFPELETAALKIARDAGKVDAGPWPRSYAFLWKTRIDYLAYVRMQAHLLLWLGLLSEALLQQSWKLNIPAGVDSRLARALFVIDTQDPYEPFPLKKMISESGLTAWRMNKICESAYGLTTHAYWEKRRVERARQALEQGGLNVKVIASDLGFTQLSHFSAWFKRHTGFSPRAYRIRSGSKEQLKPENATVT